MFLMREPFLVSLCGQSSNNVAADGFSGVDCEKKGILMVIKGLVFDMDGLLFDSERIVQRSWNAAGADLGYPDIGEHIYHTVGFNRARREVYFKGVYGEDFPHDVFQEKAAVYFLEIVEREGMPVKKGARELLNFAKDQGLRLGVATSSSSDYAADNLKNAGLYDYFDGFVYGNMVEHSKPDKEIYEKACFAIGVVPEEAVALEDAPSGIASAYAAGLKPVMVPDLVKPDSETLEKVWLLRDSLLEVIPDLEACLKHSDKHNMG